KVSASAIGKPGWRQLAATGVTKDGSTYPRFHHDGSALRRPQLRAAPCHTVARRRRLGVGYARQPLSRLPLRLFGGEPGPLPSENPGRYGGAGEQADIDLPRLPQRPTSPLLRTDRGAYWLPQSAANEQRCRGRGERDQVRAQVGLRSEGGAGRTSRDHRLRRQLPRTHPRYHRLQHWRGGARAFWVPLATPRRWRR